MGKLNHSLIYNWLLQVTNNGLRWDLNPEFSCPKVHVPKPCANSDLEFLKKIFFPRHCPCPCLQVSLLLIRLWAVNHWTLSGRIWRLFTFEFTSANTWTFLIAYRWINTFKPNPHGKEEHHSGTLSLHVWKSHFSSGFSRNKVLPSFKHL